MNVEELRNYCLSLPQVTEKMPWANGKVFSGGLCFYICDKWFCITDLDDFQFINIKLPPEMNIELRERYEAVQPGWHMNKKYWSSIFFDRDLPDSRIKELIATAYATVVASLPPKKKAEAGL